MADALLNGMAINVRNDILTQITVSVSSYYLHSLVFIVTTRSHCHIYLDQCSSLKLRMPRCMQCLHVGILSAEIGHCNF